MNAGNVVADTNVPIIANGRDTHVDGPCPESGGDPEPPHWEIISTRLVSFSEWISSSQTRILQTCSRTRFGCSGPKPEPCPTLVSVATEKSTL